jgi:hypothetical protein
MLLLDPHSIGRAADVTKGRSMQRRNGRCRPDWRCREGERSALLEIAIGIRRAHPDEIPRQAAVLVDPALDNTSMVSAPATAGSRIANTTRSRERMFMKAFLVQMTIGRSGFSGSVKRRES